MHVQTKVKSINSAARPKSRGGIKYILETKIRHEYLMHSKKVEADLQLSVLQKLPQRAVEIIELRHLCRINFAPVHHELQQLFVLVLEATFRLEGLGERVGQVGDGKRMSGSQENKGRRRKNRGD